MTNVDKQGKIKIELVRMERIMKINRFLGKLKKILITVICIITVFFSMPVKSSADVGILESIADFILLIPDGINKILNTYISDETEDVKFWLKVGVVDEDAGMFSNDSGRLYNIEVTPYDIFTAGTPTLYGKYIEAVDNADQAEQNAQEKINNLEIYEAIQANKDILAAADTASELYNELNDAGSYTTKNLVKMPLLDANFFKKSTGDSSNSADILRPIVSNVYNNLRNFVLILMLVILLYIGIRIIISSAVSEQVKYKQYLIDWIVGICLVFLMQYIMSAIMNVNQTVNDMLVTSQDGEIYTIGFSTKDSKFSSGLRTIAKANNSAANFFGARFWNIGKFGRKTRKGILKSI